MRAWPSLIFAPLLCGVSLLLLRGLVTGRNDVRMTKVVERDALTRKERGAERTQLATQHQATPNHLLQDPVRVAHTAGRRRANSHP